MVLSTGEYWRVLVQSIDLTMKAIKKEAADACEQSEKVCSTNGCVKTAREPQLAFLRPLSFATQLAFLRPLSFPTQLAFLRPLSFATQAWNRRRSVS
jgi:hypothetical protein